MTRSRAGRPSHVPTDETRNMVESLSGFGIPQDEIARLVGIEPPLEFRNPSHKRCDLRRLRLDQRDQFFTGQNIWRSSDHPLLE